jgi:predicted phage baseplate assembly protein
MSALATAPVLDPRTYQDLVDEALARIPIHNPEWTNFNESDPGVTLLELFAFLTDSLLYRANQIPERNRLAFLSLLGVPLKAATAAQGIVVLSNDSGQLQTTTLSADLEVLAGQIPYRTQMGLDLLPVEGQVYYKQPVSNPSQQLIDYYRALYASYTGPAPDLTTLTLYETAQLSPDQPSGVDLTQTADGSLWIALLLRRVDGTGDQALASARAALAGKTLSLGIVPVQDDPDATLSPLGRSAQNAQARLDYQLPQVPPDGSLGARATRVPNYVSLDAVASANVLDEPGIVQLTLPDQAGLGYWTDIDPLEAGAGALPPALEDTNLAARLITWLRITAPSGGQATLLWAGINAASVSQQTLVVDEVLPNGTGTPSQTLQLASVPVVPDSVTISVNAAAWTEVGDLYSAGAEVPVPDLRLPPGAPSPPQTPATVYTVDPASGTVTFGDGMHGARPPLGATIRASYAYGAGRAGNVGAGSISSSPSLPPGAKVTNPLRTWGGADAESISDGESQIPRYLQYRDRLVSADDFDAVVRRTPGISVGRVDVIPAFNPELSPNAPGDAAGAVTLMLIPQVDPDHPDAPQPDQPFLDAVCDYIDPRRLVTTEVFLRGPTYVPIWVSVGFEVVAGLSVATIRNAIKGALLAFLAPLPDPDNAAAFAHADTGWPLLKPVIALELLAVASRVPGVDLVQPVLVGAGGSGGGSDTIAMNGLQLPQVVGISVLSGDPRSLSQVQGVGPAPAAPNVLPVPVIPDTC